jgi:serine protease Do
LWFITTLLGLWVGGHRPTWAQDGPLGDSDLTNGKAMRRVFAEVVGDANRWTVRVLADDVQVALGVIVSDDGYILTTGSRLEGELECELPGFRALPAEYVGYHPDHDLALLKVDASALPVVRWQTADDPAVGRWVITPDAQGPPRAVGVVSVARREVPEVKVQGVLGVQLGSPEGPASIQEVMPNSAAEQAGLRAGDIITRVNQTQVDSPGTLVAEIGQHSPGEMLSLHVLRGGDTLTIDVTLTHPFGRFLSRIAMQNQMGGRLSPRRTGFPVILQHDSVLQPEECGGPLVDLSGAAVGVNIARAGRTESYAIPDDVVRTVIEELVAGQHPPPALKLARTVARQSELKTSAASGE